MAIFNYNGFNPLVSHNTIHTGAIYKLVENNFGISIVPKSLQPENNETIKFIDLTKIPQRTTLSVIWSNENQNPILSKFVSIITKENIK